MANTHEAQGHIARWWVLGVGALPAIIAAAAIVVAGDDASIGTLRRIAGVITAIAFPGVLLIPLIARFRPRSEPWDVTTFGLLAYGATVLSHIVVVNGFKAAGLSASPFAVLAVQACVGAAATAAWWRHPPRFHPPSRSGAIATLIATALVGAWAVGDRAYIAQDLSAWYYHEAPMAWAYDGVELDDAGIRYEGPGALPAGQPEAHGAVSLVATGPGNGDVRLFYVLKGPIGAELNVDCGEAGAQRVAITRDVTEVAEEGPVPRYQHRGAAALALTVGVEAGGSVSCQWQAAGLDAGSALVDFTALPDWRIHEEGPAHGLHLAHYYQILNIVENVRWAEEVLGPRLLTIHQPPLWSYAYSAVVLYAGSHLVAINAYFYLLILAMALVAFRTVRVQAPRIHPAFMAPVALMALSHAKIVTASGSSNFPDNLYALALLAAFYGLVSAQRGLYIGAGLAATFLRYPGSTVVLIIAAVTALADRSRRSFALRSGGVFVAILLVPCLLLGLGALATGHLGHWLEILWFETFPEHFHGDYALAALLPRPPEFYGLWLKYAGYTPLLLVGLRGRVARSALATASVYSLFLCFIDHFPSHYFLPLLALTGVAVTASVARWKAPLPWVGLGLACAGLGWWLLLGVP